MTKDDVRAEHLRAMGRLDPEQVDALKRINSAFRNSRFTNQTVREALDAIFDQEARHRSGDGPPPPHADGDGDPNAHDG